MSEENGMPRVGLQVEHKGREGGSEGRRLAEREEVDRWMEERREGWSVG